MDEAKDFFLSNACDNLALMLATLITRGIKLQTHVVRLLTVCAMMGGMDTCDAAPSRQQGKGKLFPSETQFNVFQQFTFSFVVETMLVSIFWLHNTFD